jgi:DNA polymerase-3 subunit delta'
MAVPFSSIVGHSRVVDLLRRAVERDSVPQSLIFAGPEGVGKRATALALAQAVNCRQAVEGDACGTCQTCRRIATGTFSDVVVLDKDGEASIKLEPLRTRVLEPVGYRPFEGRRRVFIIDPADDLTSQDALLKTLEEPPPSAILILITAYPDALLGTVRSRCRRVRFGALAPDEVARVLTDVVGIPPAKAQHLAIVSAGSVARALASDERDFLGDRQAALALIEAARDRRLPPRLKAAAAFSQVDKKRRARDAAFARLAILSSILRDITVAHAGAGTLFNTDMHDTIAGLAPAFPPERLLAGFAAVQHAEQSIDRNASPKIVADWLAVRL